MSYMSQCYTVIIDWGICAPGHRNQVEDGLNAIDKRYIYQLISNVQLSGSNIFDSQLQMHTGNQNKDVSLSKEFQQHLKKEHYEKWCHWSGKIQKRLMEKKMDRRKSSCSG